MLVRRMRRTFQPRALTLLQLLEIGPSKLSEVGNPPTRRTRSTPRVRPDVLRLVPHVYPPLLPLDPFQCTTQQYSWSTPRPRHHIPSAQLHEEYLIHQIVVEEGGNDVRVIVSPPTTRKKHPPTTSLGKRLGVDGRRRRGGTAHRRRRATGGQGERIPPTVGRRAAIFAQRVIPSAAAR